MRYRSSIAAAALLVATMAGALGLHAEAAPDASTIEKQIGGLRALPDDRRAEATRRISRDIRGLADPTSKLDLAIGLSNLVTEGDFGADTLQSVATTLEQGLREAREKGPKPPEYAYQALARLARYEGAKVTLDAPEYGAAIAQFEADDKAVAAADFALKDLSGATWTLSKLRGKVVLANFWATWCPPCRKEIPDIVALYHRFRSKGFVVLGISSEKADVLRKYASAHGMDYPILIDQGDEISKAFRVMGIPRTLVYGRDGKLAAQAMDMRTIKQLQAMLAKAGLR